MPAGISDTQGAPPAADGIGFCGKLPSHGDFLRRRIPPAIARRWEEWLDAGVAASRDALGANWRDAYLAAPIWRFALSAGCCGDTALAGIVMPSLDKVGRYHPLCLVALLPHGTTAACVALFGTEWFCEIECLALSALAEDFDFDAFDAGLSAVRLPDNFPSPSTDSGGATAAMLIAQVMELRCRPYGLWWTPGTPGGPHSFFACPGFPEPEQFVHLLLPAE